MAWLTPKTTWLSTESVTLTDMNRIEANLLHLYQNFLLADGTNAMLGPLVLNADPTIALHAATKQYVDTQVATVKN